MFANFGYKTHNIGAEKIQNQVNDFIKKVQGI